MTTASDDATIALIKPVALAPCQEPLLHESNFPVDCGVFEHPWECQCKPVNVLKGHAPACQCKGSGYHPLSELLRVKCIGWAGGVNQGYATFHDDDCCGGSGYCPATLDESEAVFHGLLSEVRAKVEPGLRPLWYIRIPGYTSDGIGRGDTPLDALLRAMAQVMNVEVPA